jgi:flagellar hook-associated protein 1
MSSLFATLHTASNALDAMERAMGVIQNNVTNASTPGYVTQTLNLTARAFNPTGSLWGGVQAGEVENSRNQFAEDSVWSQSALLGSATQSASSLSSLQSIFDVSGQSGIPAALSNLYSAFSAWSTTPTDTTMQQQVITAAQGIAEAFNQASASIQQISSQANGQLENTADQINQLTSQIAAMNGQIRGGDRNDAGLEANLYNTLEKLSSLTSIRVQNETDGTLTVLMNGQTPLVLGTTLTQLQVTYLGSVGPPNSNAPASAHIMTSSGQDVTSIVSGGQLAAVLQFHNTTLPSIIGDNQQQGSLNQLAQAIADQVNGLLMSGQTSSGATGTALFTYNGSTPTSVAATLSVNPAITASQLAAIQPGPPAVANGIARQLAQLSTSPDPTLQMNYTDYYSGIASGVGEQAANASTAQQTQTQLLTQAQDMRSQLSGVSLNEQAANLLQFQQAYEASAQMITVINSTTQYLLSMMQGL